MLDRIMKFFGKRKKPESIIGSKASDIEDARKKTEAKFKKKKKRTLSSQLPKEKRQQKPLVKPKLKGMGLDPDVVDDVLELMEPTSYQREQDSYDSDDSDD